MTEKDNYNGTKKFIPGSIVRGAIRVDLQQAAQPVVPLGASTSTSLSYRNRKMEMYTGSSTQAISSLFMGNLVHAQFLGEVLQYDYCISCNAAYHADQMEIDVYEDRLGGKVAARARLCITCWTQHQHILKHCIQVVP